MKIRYFWSSAVKYTVIQCGHDVAIIGDAARHLDSDDCIVNLLSWDDGREYFYIVSNFGLKYYVELEKE